MGSKNRHAKELLPIILRDRHLGQYYVEPFVGGFNMIDKVNGNRIGSDINYYLIKLFKAVQNGWIPPDNVNVDEYYSIKNNKNDYPPHLVGFVGFGCSYSGRWFEGYARGGKSNGKPRNYCAESQRNILKQADKIQGIDIKNSEYDELHLPPNSIIYCDPPYQNTKRYKDAFDHEKYWDWVREKVKEGHDVYVSEYAAPSDFIEIWSKEVNSSLTKATGSKQSIEKLFRHSTYV